MKDIQETISKPFQQGDLVKLALYTGAILVFAWAWVQILRPVKDVVEEVVEEVVENTTNA